MKKPSIKPMLFWRHSSNSPPAHSELLLRQAPSVFETFTVHGLRGCSHLKERIARLQESAKSLGMKAAWSREDSNWLKNVLIKIKTTKVARLSVHKDSAGVAYCLCLKEFPASLKTLRQKGVVIKTASILNHHPKAEVTGAKRNNYLSAVLSYLAQAGSDQAGIYETLFMNRDGTVAEGRTANVFIVIKDSIWTPPLSCGILGGITRRTLIDDAQKSGCRVKEVPFTRHSVYNAREVFLTNSVIGVIPVVKADGRVISDGVPGPMAEKFHNFLDAALRPVE